uniref:Protein kinase domain-containing protein n=1 Tax=Ditylenchus dipsaci TaxID=166011 RepID=A0A915E8W8_9BILA
MTESIILCGRFHLLKEIGKGGFSIVYSCNDITDLSDKSAKKFAIKQEPKKTKYSVLWHELEVLKKLEGIPGIPNVHHHETYLSQRHAAKPQG